MMTKLTRATITIEIEVPVSGTWAPPDPDVGINEGWFEDAGIAAELPMTANHATLDETYADEIQEALAEARRDDMEDDGDARFDAARDRRLMGND
jgi:hypothetical protein